MRVVAVTTTHSREVLLAADRIVTSLADVKAFIL
jgi:hypothetical protein